MLFIKARDVRNIEDSFVELLENSRGSKRDKQAFFKKLGIKIPRKNYETMWDELVERTDRVKAGEAVLKYTLHSVNQRTKKLLKISKRGESVKLRDNELKIIKTIYFDNGNLRLIGKYLIECMDELNLSWDDIENKSSSIVVDIEPSKMQTSIPCDINVFISCGDRENEISVGDWLWKTLQKTKNVNPFWWKKLSPPKGNKRSFQQELLDKAKSSDAIIGVLHYRETAKGEAAHFSLACYDEISGAFDAGVPTIVFRETKVPLSGMKLGSIEAVLITKVSEMYERLPSFLENAGKRAINEEGNELSQTEGDIPSISFRTEDVTLYNLEIVNTYIKLLDSNELSNQRINQIIGRIRSEVLKIYRKKQINIEITRSISRLINVVYKIMEEKDDKELNNNIIDIMDLLVKTDIKLLRMVKRKLYQKLKEIYEDGIYSKDLISILYDFGYFKNIKNEIMEAIDEKNNILLSYFISKFDFTKIKNLNKFITQLWLKKDNLDDDEDKQIIEQINYLINQIEYSMEKKE